MLVPLGVWLACAAACGAARARPRVLGGADDVHQHFPFAVTLEPDAMITNFTELRQCTGSLITPAWVLTAAHCTPNDDADRIRLRMRYGDFEKLQNETTKYSKILRCVPHPNYVTCGDGKQFINYNDIGLAQVEPVTTLALATLSAVDYRSLAGQQAELAGFSPLVQINPELKQETRPLQVLEVMIISTCKTFNKRKVNPTICVQSKCGEDSILTAGDSGGPLLHDGRLVGVASFSQYNARISSAGFTPISPYLNWIQEVVSTKTL